MKQAVPQSKTGIEIGVGSGRFAEPLNINMERMEAVEQSENASEPLCNLKLIKI